MTDTIRRIVSDTLWRKPRVIHSAYKKFDKQNFSKDVLREFPKLELKQRIYHIRDMLHAYLPKDYLIVTQIILKALPKELDNTLTDGDYGDFIHAPYAEYVATYGMEKKYLKHSLDMLEEISKRFTVEYAIRHFLNNHKIQTLKRCVMWSKSKHYHIRRLASEGSRPRLPWGINVNVDYKETGSILDNLYNDKTRYVTRSVANHLNDISKIDKAYVLEKLEEWDKSKKQNQKEMDFIIKHALRTLNKK